MFLKQPEMNFASKIPLNQHANSEIILLLMFQGFSGAFD